MNNVLSIPKNTAICPEGSLISLQQSLDAGQDCDVILPLFYALVAQLDRALDYESRGREFESSRARHFLPIFSDGYQIRVSVCSQRTSVLTQI